MTQLNYPIPDDLHRRVKVLAAQQGVTLRDFLIRVLDTAATELEQENQR